MKKKAVKKKTAAPAAPKTSPAKLTAVRKNLLEMREDLIKTVHKQQVTEDSMETGDAADQASQSIEKEIMFELSDNERMTLDQIEAALRKIDKGAYGQCESCRKPIAKPRLEALPFARYCISCQNSAEKAPDMAGEPAGEFRAIGEES